MNRVLQATYHDGNLVLEEKLDAALEGKKLTVIVMEDELSLEQTDPNVEKHQQFIKWINQYSAELLPGYKFDCDEIHERL
ncbi:MAG: hypothetical protein HC881_01635 [Leptolyngbyaceae cyanobacterium SL_7_1]|nr:hypothetical protein [Leptolyngbyaceae cyanobacterium SL_7_1]